MPVARVKLSDGRVARFEVPEGTTQEQVIAYAQDLEKQQGISAPAPQQDRLGAALDTVKDLPRYGMDALRSAGTGAMDLVVGAGQLASRFMGDEQRQRYADYMRTREADYQAGRIHAEQPDVGRFTGALVAGGALGAGAPAATLGGRMLQGAKIGGMLGLTSPVDPETESYWLAKGLQTGGGALVGAAAPAVVEGVIRGTGAAVNALRGQIRGMRTSITGAAKSGRIEAALSESLSKEGVTWSQIPNDVRASLVSEVQKSLKAGGTLDDAATRRLGDFLRLRIAPTQGQVSRNPLQFAREQNLSKLEPGRPLAERFTQQNQQLIGAVDDIRASTGAKAADPYAAGQNVVTALRAQDAARKAGVDTAYTKARALAGMDSEVPAQPVADRLGKIVEEFGSDKIPGAVAGRLNEFGLMGGKQTKLLTIREAEKLKTLIGNNIDNPATPGGKALTLLKQSVDDAINNIGDDAGSQAAGAFREARQLAAGRFESLRRTPGLEKAISRDFGAPEKFIESEIIRGDIQGVANAMMRMGKDARREVQAAVLDWIKGKGVTGVEDAAKFTQAGFNRALGALGERKLRLIFAGNRDALRQLQALGRVGAYIQSPPVGSAVNYSNTATTGLGFLDQFARMATLGLPFKPGDIVRGAQAAGAVRAPSPTQQLPALLSPALLDRSAILSGQLAAPAGALSVPLLLEQLTKKRAQRK